MAFGLAIALMIAVIQEPHDRPAEPQHWSNGQLAWARMPIPDFPAREEGTVQAELTCTVAERGRVRDCHVDRLAPDRTRFGREVIQSMGRARLVEGRARAGDTMTFVVWACGSTPEGEPCRKIDWPPVE